MSDLKTMMQAALEAAKLNAVERDEDRARLARIEAQLDQLIELQTETNKLLKALLTHPDIGPKIHGHR